MGLFRDCTALAMLFAGATSLKVGLISDMHMHLRYEKNIGVREGEDEGDCMKGSGMPSTTTAPMGRYGCDPPVVMLESLLYNFNEKFGK